MPRQDYTAWFNTSLSPEDEKKFEAWAKANGRTADVADYDLRGAWKDNAKEAENGHLPDTYKKPNHPTFSDESKYSNPTNGVGGKWEQDAKGKWAYYPSDANLKNMSADELRAYFAKEEPDASLVMPLNQNQAWFARKPVK
ncbi:hypothetical protein [Sphingomonas asaccharolytica]|uniref:hypothetical protein n=1 Tax=Sphingomonas asaccharolytica TaxID=40681 RepID=UPI00082A18F5|nr:hypothetical protein [Sphingomonas asaccharolytica]